jgi:hypothetical protein
MWSSLSLFLSPPQYHSPKLWKKTSPQTWHKGQHRSCSTIFLKGKQSTFFPCANSWGFFFMPWYASFGLCLGQCIHGPTSLAKKKAGFKLSVPQIVKHKSHHQHTIHWKPIIYNSVVDEHKLSWHQVSPRWPLL